MGDPVKIIPIIWINKFFRDYLLRFINDNILYITSQHINKPILIPCFLVCIVSSIFGSTSYLSKFFSNYISKFIKLKSPILSFKFNIFSLTIKIYLVCNSRAWLCGKYNYKFTYNLISFISKMMTFNIAYFFNLL